MPAQFRTSILSIKRTLLEDTTLTCEQKVELYEQLVDNYDGLLGQIERVSIQTYNSVRDISTAYND